LPAARILDAPRYAWRGLSLDLARTFFTLEEVRRVIDLLALYKLNVLHLHLTDDQSWRLSVGRPAASPEPDAAFYGADGLRALVAIAGLHLPPPEPLGDAGLERTRLFEAVSRLVERVAAERPLVLLVDDLPRRGAHPPGAAGAGALAAATRAG
jgi:hypothetical protein